MDCHQAVWRALRPAATFIDDLVVQAVQSQFKAVCDAEFFVDFAETVLYDLFGGSQLRCNTFIAPSAWERGAGPWADLASQLPGHG